MTPEICPNCGADVPARAKACPECGACEETGWSEASSADALGLPDEDFNYDEFVEREFGGRKPVRPGIPQWVWIITAALIVFLLALRFF